VEVRRRSEVARGAPVSLVDREASSAPACCIRSRPAGPPETSESWPRT